MTDADIQALRARNDERARAAAVALGTRYLCHPSNRVARLTPIAGPLQLTKR